LTRRRNPGHPPQRSSALRPDRTGPLLDQRIAEIDHTLRELRELRATLRELRATLIAARRTDHHTDADRAGDVGNDDPGGICPMIQDATTPGRR